MNVIVWFLWALMILAGMFWAGVGVLIALLVWCLIGLAMRRRRNVRLGWPHDGALRPLPWWRIW